MDYLAYYGLTHNPFDKENSAVFETIDLKEVNVRLAYMCKTLGFCTITGSPGVGKTFALRQFTTKLNPNIYRICYLQLSTVSIPDFYQAIGKSLGIDVPHRKIDKFHQIQERIATLHDKNKITPIFIFDEAQYLKGPVLQELVMLFNFDMDSKKNCLVLLTGLPYLTQVIDRAPFEPLKQRILTNYEFVGLEVNEIHAYLDKLLNEANRSTPLFSEAAEEALHSNANGSIRKLNNILTQSLLLGAAKEKSIIDTDTILAAITELNFI